jgi:hypothetical protein
LKANPYSSFKQENTTVSTPVFSLSFLESNKTVISVEGLLSPFTFTIPITTPVPVITTTAAPTTTSTKAPATTTTTKAPITTTSAPSTGYQLQCIFWDALNKVWNATGCKMVSTTLIDITCACTHTTDFAALFAPQVNLLTVQDLENITKLNIDNMLTVIVVCAMAGIYITGVIFFCIAHFIGNSYWYRTRYPTKDENMPIKGRFRDLISIFIAGHKYLAIAFITKSVSAKNFYRVEKLTILYVSVVGMLCSNAISFHTTNTNFVQFVAAAVIANLFSTPFVLILVLLLEKTEERKSRKIDTDSISNHG